MKKQEIILCRLRFLKSAALCSMLDVIRVFFRFYIYCFMVPEVVYHPRLEMDYARKRILIEEVDALGVHSL